MSPHESSSIFIIKSSEINSAKFNKIILLRIPFTYPLGNINIVSYHENFEGANTLWAAKEFDNFSVSPNRQLRKTSVN